jgi:hypothetical protein
MNTILKMNDDYTAYLVGIGEVKDLTIAHETEITPVNFWLLWDRETKENPQNIVTILSTRVSFVCEFADLPEILELENCQIKKVNKSLKRDNLYFYEYEVVK